MTILLPEMDLNRIELRKHCMVTTVFTPKMLALFDVFRCSGGRNTNMLRCSENLVAVCNNCLSQSNINAASISNLPVFVFHRTAQLYALKDVVLLSASIQEKILLWKLSLAEAYQEYLHHASEKILSFNGIRQVPHQAEVAILTDAQIINELLDYADEIEAWLDVEFAEEYDDYLEQPEFDDVVRILAELHILISYLEG